jgi:TATA-box binding protein (TBP) (component of TFIID and TFIIIB)
MSNSISIHEQSNVKYRENVQTRGYKSCVLNSDQNNSFQFLLTLEHFRKNIPENLRPSWVKLTTITMVSNWKSENKIDIEKIKQYFNRVPSGFFMRLRKKGRTYGGNGFEISLKPTTFYNQVTLNYVDKYSTKSIKIFPNGSIQIAGCADLFNCRSVIKIIHTMLKKFLKNDDLPKDDSYRVVMINSNFSLNYNINLMEIKTHFENAKPKNERCTFKVSFEPDRYSAVKIKFKPSGDMKEITTSIFSTGKIIITGAETLKEIAFAYNIINEHINSNKDIRVKKSLIPEEFNLSSGYNIKDLIDWAKKLGLRTWVQTINNRRIIF